MYTAKISTKFQVVIPREVREQFGLKPGQRIAFIPFKKSLHVVIVPSLDKARGMLKGMDTENFREEQDEDRL